MIKIKDRVKGIIKILFVVAIVGAIIFTFRNSAVPIYKELKKTSIWLIIAICSLSFLYELVEGWITYSFARRYNKKFTYAMAVESAFYCSFYRVSTLGSGAGLAAIYYFNEKGIPIFKGTGMYTLEYVLHKISIAIFSMILCLLNYNFMYKHYQRYSVLLILGYILTAGIAMLLVISCCSKKFHHGIIFIGKKINKNHRFDDKIKKLQDKFYMLEDATKNLLKDYKFAIMIIGKNMIKLSCWYVIPYILLYQGFELSLWEVLAITALSVMLAAVLPAPAGIGSTEFVFTLLISVFTGTAIAGSVALLYRFATFVFPFLVGILVVLKKKNKVA